MATLNNETSKLSNGPDNFPGEIHTDPFGEVVNNIKAAWAKQNGSVLEAAQLAFEANVNFKGQQKVLAKRTGLTESTFSKLIKIGSCPELHYAKYRQQLPVGVSLLYELAKVENLHLVLDDGTVHRDMSRDDIIRLRENQATKIQKDGLLFAIMDHGEPEQITTAPAFPNDQPSPQTKRKLMLPPCAYAVIGMPRSQEDMARIREALDQIRALDVHVIDREQYEAKILNKFEGARYSKVIEHIEKEIRGRIREINKRNKRTKIPPFAPDEVELDGTLQRAREVFEYIGYEGEWNDLYRMAQDAVPYPKRYYTESQLPSFEDEPMSSSRLISFGEKKVGRDFSMIDFN